MYFKEAQDVAVLLSEGPKSLHSQTQTPQPSLADLFNAEAAA